jgi:signal transduction histidine kinase
MPERERRERTLASSVEPDATQLDPRMASGPVAATSQTRLEQALAAVRQQQTAIAVAAHDMKNNLTVIRSAVQLVERHLGRTAVPEPARLLDYMATITSGTQKLQRLVDEFLDLARLQSGEALELNRAPTDLVALARACVAAYTLTANRTLTFATTTYLLVGYWDAARLERVLANLVSNAIKYSAAGSAIRVLLGSDAGGEAAVLVVEDQGVGIPATELPHVFEPFYRASNVAQHIAGTGIGLFGARALLEQQGGTLVVASTAGVGTTVTLQLPLSAETPHAVTTVARRPQQRHKPRR